MKFLFSSTVLSLLLVDPSSSIAAESSAAASESSNQHLYDSVSMASEDITSSVHDVTTPDHVLRVLKKKRKKNPKSGNKESKSAKGSATLSPSPQPSPQESSQPSPPQESSQPSLSSQPTDPCASISTPVDALLALKAGFTNGNDKLSEWSSDTEPCTGSSSNWGTTIGCTSSGEVKGIVISGYLALEGTISPLIGCPTTLVSSLTEFNISRFFTFDNSVSGSIPTELGALTSLTTVKLAFNELTGSMPSEICALRTSSGGTLATLEADYCPPTPEVTCDCCTNFCG